MCRRWILMHLTIDLYVLIPDCTSMDALLLIATLTLNTYSHRKKKNIIMKFMPVKVAKGLSSLYQSRGNRCVHEACISTVYIFDHDAEMTELPHVQRAHLGLV